MPDHTPTPTPIPPPTDGERETAARLCEVLNQGIHIANVGTTAVGCKYKAVLGYDAEYLLHRALAAARESGRREGLEEGRADARRLDWLTANRCELVIHCHGRSLEYDWQVINSAGGEVLATGLSPRAAIDAAQTPTQPPMKHPTQADREGANRIASEHLLHDDVAADIAAALADATERGRREGLEEAARKTCIGCAQGLKVRYDDDHGWLHFHGHNEDGAIETECDAGPIHATRERPAQTPAATTEEGRDGRMEP